MERHSRADEKYYIEAGKLLELARRAAELFESSEDSEKRELLKFLLQNSKMDKEKLVPTLQMPFDAILSANKSQTWLTNVSALRTHFLETEEEYEPIFLP